MNATERCFEQLKAAINFLKAPDLPGRQLVVLFAQDNPAGANIRAMLGLDSFNSGLVAIDGQPAIGPNAYRANGVAGIDLAAFRPLAPKLVLVDCGFSSPIHSAFPEPFIISTEHIDQERLAEMLDSYFGSADQSDADPTKQLGCLLNVGPSSIGPGNATDEHKDHSAALFLSHVASRFAVASK